MGGQDNRSQAKGWGHVRQRHKSKYYVSSVLQSFPVQPHTLVQEQDTGPWLFNGMDLNTQDRSLPAQAQPSYSEANPRVVIGQ